ncbi:MAG: alanine--tRNA ligase [Legionellales bacterium]|nr:alanine--tRNA ligase [Legionellales bacterium]
MKTSNEIRELFINYFAKKGHEIVPSSSLVPHNDPTLLFTNAGMVQFKDVFLGKDKRNYSKATSSQRCVRAGGKHNDLEQVGYTARHHTFFEMLGNFSFGDYFKREAIEYAWTFLTQILNLPEDKLWVTVFEEDQESEDIWLKKMKINPHRFSRCGEKDNFWRMGDTGPCGPCTEIFYDHGESIPGGPPGSPDEDGDRYIEIWNLVFMQYDQLPNGELKPLPKPSVDTGMGLERLTAVLQHVHNNYETDLFTPMLATISQLANNPDTQNTSMRVIADHIRACAFLIVDGVVPNNEGRGYVLRRIIRRAIRHGHKLGINDMFFYKLVKPLIEKMGTAYPELVKSQNSIEELLQQEETQFIRTLDQGLKIFEQDIANLSSRIIPGNIIFKLYDTYGFPPDLTGDIARERGLELDLDGFTQEMANQRSKSQSTGKFSANYHDLPIIEQTTTFLGYDKLHHHTPIQDIIVKGQFVEKITEQEEAVIILTESPFYAESGGQVGDTGALVNQENIFIVTDTQKHGSSIAHFGYVKQGTFLKTDKLDAIVDQEKRKKTALNHSATHLLHAALKAVLGNHIQQKGSLVNPERLRFDFSNLKPLSLKEINTIEALVNQKIRDNLRVTTHIMDSKQAIAEGAVALFGEKYGDKVRVLSMEKFSKELCGGTHIKQTGDIGLFKIISENAVAAGIRRIEALTGQNALDYCTQNEMQLMLTADLLKTNKDKLHDKVTQLLSQMKQQEKQIQQLQQKLASGQGNDLSTKAIDVNGIQLLVEKLDNVDMKTLRNTLDQLKDKLKHGVILLATVNDHKVNLVVGVTKPLQNQLSSKAVVQHITPMIDGKGGGRDDMAQAGGNNAQMLDEALAKTQAWIVQTIKSLT